MHQTVKQRLQDKGCAFNNSGKNNKKKRAITTAIIEVQQDVEKNLSDVSVSRSGPRGGRLERRDACCRRGCCIGLAKRGCRSKSQYRVDDEAKREMASLGNSVSSLPEPLILLLG